jgi:ribosome-binding protein aMBF1 (putative translation factor)
MRYPARFAEPRSLTSPVALSWLAGTATLDRRIVEGASNTVARRPGAARRAAELATPEGLALAQAARRTLGVALADDGVVELAALRMKAGLSQQQLATQLRMAQPAISRIESGLQDIKGDTVHRIASALGVTPGDVFEAHRRTKCAREAALAKARLP